MTLQVSGGSGVGVGHNSKPTGSHLGPSAKTVQPCARRARTGMLHTQLLTAVWRQWPFARHHPQLVSLLQAACACSPAPRGKRGACGWSSSPSFARVRGAAFVCICVAECPCGAFEALDLLLAWGKDKQSQLQTPRRGSAELCWTHFGLEGILLPFDSFLDGFNMFQPQLLDSPRPCEGSAASHGRAEDLCGALAAALAARARCARGR